MENKYSYETNVRKTLNALFFMQIFSTVSYGIICSTTVLYGIRVLSMKPSIIETVMGTFLTLNFGLHFLGGYLGGRYLSNRIIFLIGIILQAGACWFIVIEHAQLKHFIYGLIIFLMGSGTSLTCLNNIITEQFKQNEIEKRLKAFLFNYSGMNIGFLFGFAIAGYYTLQNIYHTQFIIGGISSLIAIILTLLAWKRLKDQNTSLANMPRQQHPLLAIKAVSIMVIVFIILIIFYKHMIFFDFIVIAITAIAVITTIIFVVAKADQEIKSKMKAFLILLLAAFVFWTIYQLTPIGVMLFIADNVNLYAFKYRLAPQWFGLINNLVLIVGCPIFAYFAIKLKSKGFVLSRPRLFAIPLLFITIATFMLPLGIKYASADGVIDIKWICSQHIFLAMGELFLYPIGFAVIGRLVPRKFQGTMMGLWLLTAGIGGIAAGFISTLAIRHKQVFVPLNTDPGYFNVFLTMTIIAAAVCIIMFIFAPKIYRLMSKDDKIEEI